MIIVYINVFSNFYYDVFFDSIDMNYDVEAIKNKYKYNTKYEYVLDDHIGNLNKQEGPYPSFMYVKLHSDNVIIDSLREVLAICLDSSYYFIMCNNDKFPLLKELSENLKHHYSKFDIRTNQLHYSLNDIYDDTKITCPVIYIEDVNGNVGMLHILELLNELRKKSANGNLS